MNGNIQSKTISIFSWIICDLFILFKITLVLLTCMPSGSLQLVRPTKFSCSPTSSTVLWEPLSFPVCCELCLPCQFGQTGLEGLYGMTTWNFLHLWVAATIFYDLNPKLLEEILCQIHSFIVNIFYLRCRTFSEL